MSRGARPKPTSLKVLHGTVRADRLNLAEPRPPVGAPRCPKWLGAVAREYWRELAPVLVGMRVLTRADRLALAQLCDAVATYRAAREVVAREGATFAVETESGRVVRPRPEVQIAQDADRRIRVWAAEFGLTPAGRPRISTLVPEARPENRFAALEERYFGGRRRA